LRNSYITAFGQFRDLLPDRLGLSHLTTLNGINDEILFRCFSAEIRVLRTVRIIHVRRRVADEKDDLQDFAVAAPRHLVNGFRKRLVHTLRCIATTTGLEFAQMSVNGIDVVGETEGFHDVFIAAISITNEPEL
jgi:hypothetical protein